MENYLNLIIQIISIIAGLWGIWHFLLIPKLKYKINIIPIIKPAFSLSKLKILFMDKPISELSFVCISVYNKGLGTADNFATPIIIHSNKRVLDVLVNDDAINNKVITKYSILKDNQSVELKVNFINQGEDIKCYCIIEGSDNIDISVSGRCKGCSKIKPTFMINWKSVNKYITWLWIWLFLILIIIGSILIKNRIQQMEIELKDINQNISQTVSKIKTIKNNIKTKSEN